MTRRRRKILLVVAGVVVVLLGALLTHHLLEEEAPAIPHAIENRGDCLACHARPDGMKPVPEDHAGRTNASCRGSHEPAP